jgi:hypothetical protein
MRLPYEQRNVNVFPRKGSVCLEQGDDFQCGTLDINLAAALLESVFATCTYHCLI